MKKLMIAAAIVCAAVAANAATCLWVTAGVKNQAKPTEAGSGYAAYLFLTSSTVATDPTIAKTAVEAAITGGTFDKVVSSAYATAQTNAQGGFQASGLGSYNNGDSISAYMVVFDNADYTKAGYYALWSGDDKTASWTSSTGSKSVSFTNYSASTSWTAIPEPTSGLLLLLGVAGLALRRKQK